MQRITLKEEELLPGLIDILMKMIDGLTHCCEHLWPHSNSVIVHTNLFNSNLSNVQLLTWFDPSKLEILRTFKDYIKWEF